MLLGDWQGQSELHQRVMAIWMGTVMATTATLVQTTASNGFGSR